MLKLKYYSDIKAWQFDRKSYEDYMHDYLEKNKAWNATQLNLIVDTMVNFMDTVLEIYKDTPQRAINLFQQLTVLNRNKKDINNSFINMMLAWRNSSDKNLRKILDIISIIYQMCTDNLFELKLYKFQQNRFFTTEHYQVLHEIMNDFFCTPIEKLNIIHYQTIDEIKNDASFTKLFDKNPLSKKRKHAELIEQAKPNEIT